jgi:hypothetical protein
LRVEMAGGGNRRPGFQLRARGPLSPAGGGPHLYGMAEMGKYEKVMIGLMLLATVSAAPAAALMAMIIFK